MRLHRGVIDPCLVLIYLVTWCSDSFLPIYQTELFDRCASTIPAVISITCLTSLHQVICLVNHTRKTIPMYLYVLVNQIILFFNIAHFNSLKIVHNHIFF